ncbi:hypothetical protein BH18ACT10_BH18ACT10_07710 [soil metagenome]|nr:VRR-NUC domain-containing protein [Rubrobacter sp.]
MAFDEWLNALGPGRRIKQPFRSNEIDVEARDTDPPVLEHVEIAYRGWDGPKGEHKDSMGKYSACVYPLDNEEPVRSCNEVEVAKLLRAHLGYEAFFLTTFHIPGPWRPWTIPERNAPRWLRGLDDKIHKHPYGLTDRGGMPDVVAWDPAASEPLTMAVFVECKKPREKIRKSQEQWFAAALALGIRPEACTVAIRTAP